MLRRSTGTPGTTPERGLLQADGVALTYRVLLAGNPEVENGERRYRNLPHRLQGEGVQVLRGTMIMYAKPQKMTMQITVSHHGLKGIGNNKTRRTRSHLGDNRCLAELG
jgi:hypothetical protein